VLVAGFSRTILNSMPDWALFVLIVGCVVLAALAGLLISRRYFAHWRTTTDGPVVAAVATMVMTLFALVLAFAVVTLYDQFSAASDSVSAEATDLSQIVRDSHTFPPTTQQKIDSAIKAYILEVRGTEFSRMHGGKEDPKADELFQGIFTAFQSYNPQTTAQVGFYNSAVTQLNDAVTQRRGRLEAVDAALPAAFSALLFLSAIVSILTTFFLSTENSPLEVILVCCVAVIVGAGLLTALLLQYPFSGSVAVSSHPFVTGALAQLVGTG
jgi:Protein of unknown function (DUF4239)